MGEDEQFGGGIVSGVIKAFGTSLLKKLLLNPLVILILILFFFMMAAVLVSDGSGRSMQEGMEDLYADLGKGRPGDADFDEEEYEAFWFHPQNVLNHLKKINEMIDTSAIGYSYLTEDDLRMLLKGVLDYWLSVRENIVNKYTYYHHEWYTYLDKVEYIYPDDDLEEESEKMQSLGIRYERYPTKTVTEGPAADGSYVVSTYKAYDVEQTDKEGTVVNRSIEDDPLFLITWQEIYSFASIKSLIQQSQQMDWEEEYQTGVVSGNNAHSETLVATERLDEATLKSIIDSFTYSIGYYFDPTSNRPFDASNPGGETFAQHKYLYEEMENFAYIPEEVGVNVEHGTEEIGVTPNFVYMKKKKPAVAPAIARNCYETVEYDYRENPDGTHTLMGRQVTIDGQAFYNYAKGIVGDDFDMEWLVRLLSILPGSNHDGGNGSLTDRYEMILRSYQEGTIYSYYDDTCYGVGKITLGKNLDMTKIFYEEGGYQGGSGGNPPLDDDDIDIVIGTIDDAAILADIAAGYYTAEDLIYMAACMQAESGTVEGQVAVGYCIMNRLPNYGSVAAVVSAPGQFASPWAKYLDGSFSSQARSAAAAVLKGTVQNPIGNCYYFFGAYSVWGYKPGTYHVIVGGNVFYVNWGDVTQIVNRPGYVPF